MERFYQDKAGVRAVVLEVDPTEPGHYRARVDDRSYAVVVRRHEGGRLDLLIDGQAVRAHIGSQNDVRWVHLPGLPPLTLQQVESRRSRARHAGPGDAQVVATTPAQVVAILVKVGDSVVRGTPLIVLEAMKMEFRLSATAAGRVARVGCAVGEVVERGQVLAELELATPA